VILACVLFFTVPSGGTPPADAAACSFPRYRRRGIWTWADTVACRGARCGMWQRLGVACWGSKKAEEYEGGEPDVGLITEEGRGESHGRWRRRKEKA